MGSFVQTNVPDRQFRTDRFHSSRCFPLGCPWLLALVCMVSPAGSPVIKAKSIEELKAFYVQNCTRCHGRDGSAHTLDGRKLGGMDFSQTAKNFRSLNGPASEREMRTMVRTIQKGLFFGLTMPGWKDQLSQEDATLMVREILLQAEPGKIIAPEPGPNGPK
jgi:mono/diheme cytochrome c family protein